MNETLTSNNLDAQKIGRETFGCVRWAVPLWSGAWLGTLCLGFRGDMVRIWLFMIVGIGWGGVGGGAACVCVCALSSGGCPSAGVPRGARADFVVQVLCDSNCPTCSQCPIYPATSTKPKTPLSD